MPKDRSDPIWLHWTHVSGNGKQEVVKCNYCSNKQQKHAPKCKGHSSRCGKTPLEVRKRFNDELKLKEKQLKLKKELKTILIKTLLNRKVNLRDQCPKLRGQNPKHRGQCPINRGQSPTTLI